MSFVFTIKKNTRMSLLHERLCLAPMFSVLLLIYFLIKICKVVILIKEAQTSKLESRDHISHLIKFLRIYLLKQRHKKKNIQNKDLWLVIF